MIEVKDEILNGEPKYRLKDENGIIIYDNLSIEQITPVIQEGTPIDKALFNSIKNHIDGVSSYNQLLGLNLETCEMPKLTEDDMKGYQVSWVYSRVDLSSGLSKPFEMFNGYSGNSITLHSKTTQGVKYDTGGYIEFIIKFPQYFQLKKISYSSASSTAFNGIEIFGSNDGINYETINSSDGRNGTSDYNRKIEASNGYKYFKLRFENNATGNNADVYLYSGFVISGNSTSNLDVIENLSFDIKSDILTNQILHVATPDNYCVCGNSNYSLKINENQIIELPKNLKSNAKYRLVYNGISFEVEELQKDVQLTNAIIALGGSL